MKNKKTHATDGAKQLEVSRFHGPSIKIKA